MDVEKAPNNNGKKFHWRSFISMGLALSFVLMSVSGIILYLAPPGRISRWMDWLMLGLSRSQWEAQHTLSSYLFFTLAIIHLFSMNWKAFISYLRSKVNTKKTRKKEIIAASLLFVIIFVFTLFRVSPVISIMDLGDNISDSWENKFGRPPLPHTEELSLNDIALNIIIASPDTLVSRIRELGYNVNGSDQTLKDIAKINGVSPSMIFDSLATGFSVKRIQPENDGSTY